jgi:hypothetical protein
MLKTGESHSQVASLLLKISLEYEAAVLGLHGLSLGNCQHTFITQRMENMAHLHNQLRVIVGDDATTLVSDTLDKLPL